MASLGRPCQPIRRFPICLPSRGTIRFAGQELTAQSEDERALLWRRRIGMGFQIFQLLDVLTADENVALPQAITDRRQRKVGHRSVAAGR